MILTNELITDIAEQLNIPITSDGEWVCQAVYSIAGQMALASLWDNTEESNVVSIQHFKRRALQIFDAYRNLFAQVNLRLPSDVSNLVDEIYSIYRRAGHLYHSDHRLAPASFAVSGAGNWELYRGASIDENLFMSGLGFYAAQKKRVDRSVVSMFDLQEQSFEDYLEELLSYSEWESISWPENAEYLRLDPPFKGNWLSVPSKDGRVSLARYGEPNRLYVFYRYHNGSYQQKAIPEWRIEDFRSPKSERSYGEYRRIATALLKKYNTLPQIKVSTQGPLVEIRLGYRLPPTEEDFFKLYSWPIHYNFTEQPLQVFRRKMAKQIYPVFKHELEMIGYCFTEE